MSFLKRIKSKFKIENKDKIIQDKVESLNAKSSESDISSSLEKNISLLENLFIDDDTFVTRHIKNENNTAHYYIAYCDGIVNSQIINDYIVKPLIISEIDITKKITVNDIIQKIVTISEAKETDDIKEIIESVTYGDTILFTEGLSKAIILNRKFFTTRYIS